MAAISAIRAPKITLITGIKHQLHAFRVIFKVIPFESFDKHLNSLVYKCFYFLFVWRLVLHITLSNLDTFGNDNHRMLNDD